MERKNGYYWVRFFESWEIGKYVGKGRWNMPGVEILFYDHEIDEIDENQIIRE